MQKLLRGKQLTSADIGHFTRLFLDNGFGTEGDIERAEAEHGFLDVGDLYESPFTTVSPGGTERVFGDAKVDSIQEILDRIKATATPPKSAAG